MWLNYLIFEWSSNFLCVKVPSNSVLYVWGWASFFGYWNRSFDRQFKRTAYVSICQDQTIGSGKCTSYFTLFSIFGRTTIFKKCFIEKFTHYRLKHSDVLFCKSSYLKKKPPHFQYYSVKFHKKKYTLNNKDSSTTRPAVVHQYISISKIKLCCYHTFLFTKKRWFILHVYFSLVSYFSSV